jgi:5-formaminoimidazole-4-carboxamide-1-beta-D-ribofuranosyl 5'-monophosphate synthetase
MRYKLTPRKVLSILSERCVWNCPPMRRHIAQKMSQKYRVSLKTIRDIWCGKTWTHVTGLPPYVMRYSIDNKLFEFAQTEFIDREVLAAELLGPFTFEY